MDFNSHFALDGTVSVLELKGRFDAYEVSSVEEMLRQFTEIPRAQVVVNLGGVSFVDSSGLALLVQGMKHCRLQEGDMHLCNFQRPVRIIFELSRLDKAFRIFENEEEAVGAFASV